MLNVHHECSPRTLSAMACRPTAWEVVAFFPDGSRRRLGFTCRKTKSSLLAFAARNGEVLLNHMSESEKDCEARYDREGGWRFGRVRVAFSGRTERDVASRVQAGGAL
jgi:hypothetical protein